MPGLVAGLAEGRGQGAFPPVEAVAVGGTDHTAHAAAGDEIGDPKPHGMATRE
jgi:hypothetical protein